MKRLFFHLRSRLSHQERKKTSQFAIIFYFYGVKKGEKKKIKKVADDNLKIPIFRNIKRYL